MDPAGRLVIRPASNEELLMACATMATIDPWLRLGIDADLLYRAHCADPARLAHVCECGGRIAGVVMFRLCDAVVVLGQRGASEALRKHYGGPAEDGGYVHNLAVFPGHTGQGVGRALLAHAERLVRAESDRAYLFVSDFNRRAHRFYEREGYVEIGYVENCLVEGNRENLMLKILSTAPASTNGCCLAGE